MKPKEVRRKFSTAANNQPQRFSVKGEMVDEFAEELLPTGEYVTRDVLKTAPNNITTIDKSTLNNRKG